MCGVDCCNTLLTPGECKLSLSYFCQNKVIFIFLVVKKKIRVRLACWSVLVIPIFRGLREEGGHCVGVVVVHTCTVSIVGGRRISSSRPAWAT